MTTQTLATAHVTTVAGRLDSPEYESRVDTLRAAMRERNLAAVVLAGPEGIYHQTGLDHLGYFALTLLVVPADQVPHVRHAAYTDGQDPADWRPAPWPAS